MTGIDLTGHAILVDLVHYLYTICYETQQFFLEDGGVVGIDELWFGIV